ncbi:protein PET100 homolog, mitochondrial-like [Anopheles albimanus]|nr:protein PET100 homolog, mitochondrial-like [Anopheles albimanus]
MDPDVNNSFRGSFPRKPVRRNLYLHRMGGWALEIGKMALYMTFPVAMFHWFNQPEYFEKWVTDTRRQLYPPENPEHRAQIEKAIRNVRERHDNELMKALEEMEQKEQRGKV